MPVSIDGADPKVDVDVDGSEDGIRFGLGFDGGTGVDDSAEDTPAVTGFSLPLPFFFLVFLDLDDWLSEATDSASNSPGKTVGKPTIIGDNAAVSLDDDADMPAF